MSTDARNDGPTSAASMDTASIASQDHLLKRHLGWVSIAAMTFSAMVGSGWLFAAYFGAQGAGPAALIAWVICAVAMGLVGITFMELGVTRPIDGGNVRWPAIASGPFAGTMIGWIVFMQVAVGSPTEASGLVQYAAKWWPALVADGKLSVVGLIAAVFVLFVFTALNWFGVLLLARINNLITIFKLVIPLLTVALLFASGFHTENVEAGGGFAPYGNAAILTTIIGAGMVYSFGGIQLAGGIAGEAKRPRRNLPLGTFVGLGLAFVFYILLQASFLTSVPTDMLSQAGWHGLDFASPFADLAVLLNLGWLATLLVVDGIVSPSGSALVGTGIYSRTTYGLGQKRILPRWVGKVHAGTGIPRNALVVNLALSIVFLLVFQSWQGLVATLGMLFAINYLAIALAAGANSHGARSDAARWFKGTPFVAPAAFIISALIAYWAGWSSVLTTLLLFLVSLPLFVLVAIRNPRYNPMSSLKSGMWLLVFMLALGAVSLLGSFGGLNVIHGPWDSILIAVIALAVYAWGVTASKAWLRTPESEFIDGTTLTETDLADLDAAEGAE